MVANTYRQFVRTKLSEDELQQRIRDLVGEGVRSGVLMLEIPMWYKVLFVRKDTEIEFSGVQHFGYNEKDGNVSNQFAFIDVILSKYSSCTYCCILLGVHWARCSLRLSWPMACFG